MTEEIFSRDEIARLIAGSLFGTLQAEEEIVLKDWLKDKENLRLYRRIVSEGDIDAKREFYTSLDMEKVYEKLQNRIRNQEKRSKTKFFYKIGKYAAVLLLGLSVAMVWNHFSEPKDKTVITTEETLAEIEPGNQRAVLVLADGRKVSLEEDKDQSIKSSGDVLIKNRNNTLEYEPSDRKDGSASTRYNTLYVPKKGIYTLILPDGSKLWLNSDSSVKYPEVFTGDQRVVELTGEAYFEVTKAEEEFVVRTKRQDVTVLGTSFNVSAYEDDHFFATTLVEGKVKLSHQGENDVFLAPGESGYLDLGAEKPVVVTTVDVRNYTSWKDGSFYFERHPLGDILKKMGRWYGVEVKFEEEKLRNVLFTGVARKNEPIEKLLEMIRKTALISYSAIKKENGQYEITISEK
ncbi:FecR family protein [Sinomicrobium sp.]